MDTNSFEQLCRNYAVEKLRGMFLRDEICSWTQEAAVQVDENMQLLNMLEGENSSTRLVLRCLDVCSNVKGSSERATSCSRKLLAPLQNMLK